MNGAAALHAIGRALGRHGVNLGQQRPEALEIHDPPPEQPICAQLFAARQGLDEQPVALRQTLDGLERRRDDVALVLALLCLVHLEGRVSKLVVQLLDRRGVHRATISHAWAPTAMGNPARDEESFISLTNARNIGHKLAVTVLYAPSLGEIA